MGSQDAITKIEPRIVSPSEAAASQGVSGISNSLIPDNSAKGALTPTLERQNASLGSLEFLKLLEPGPNGESLTFGDVLAANPDWADQNADQSMDQGQPGAAQRLEADRNPGGGAEQRTGTPPLFRHISDSSLLEEALKLTGPVPPSSDSEQMFGSLPSIARLFSSGPSGNFSDLAKHPSFSSQIAKDPSFSSAVFSSLLSQKSEDQNMLMQMLGIGDQPASSSLPEPALPELASASQPAPLVNGHMTAAMQSMPLHSSSQNPGYAELQHYQQRQGSAVMGPLSHLQRVPAAGPAVQAAQLPREASVASLAEHRPQAAATTASASSPALIAQWPGSRAGGAGSLPIEALPIELPRFSEELEAVQQSQQARSLPQSSTAGLGSTQSFPLQALAPNLHSISRADPAAVLDSKVITQRGRSASPLSSSTGLQTSMWPATPKLEVAELPKATQRPASAPPLHLHSQQQQQQQTLPRLARLEQRVGSLDYMLNAVSAPLVAPGPAPRHTLQPGRQLQTPGISVQALHMGQDPSMLRRRPEATGLTFQQRPEAYLPRSQAPPGARLSRQNAQLPLSYHGTVIQTPQQRAAAGLPPLAAPSITQVQRDQTGSAGLPLTATGRAHSVPGQHQQQPSHQRDMLGAAADRRSTSYPVSANLSQAALQSCAAPLPNLPKQSRITSAPSQVGPSHLPRQSQQGPQVQASGLQTAPSSEQNKSKFLSGLMTGISPILSQGTSQGADPQNGINAAAAALQLPKPYVKPLPPLPGVPSIAEYYRKTAAPTVPPASAANVKPRLEVLPLVGTATPQTPQLNIKLGEPLRAATLQPGESTARPAVTLLRAPDPSPSAQVAAAACPEQNGTAKHAAALMPGVSVTKLGQLQRRSCQANGTTFPHFTARLATPQVIDKAATVLKKLVPASPFKPPGNADAASLAALSGPRDCKRVREVASRTAVNGTKRQAVSSSSMDGRCSDDGQDDALSEGDPPGMHGSVLLDVQERKALRKAKNRASAAASRARREAYTASLEEEVKRLQKGQEWLQNQVHGGQSQGSGSEVKPGRRPRRQLSV